MQFYEDDNFLIERLADYVGAALEGGNHGIVIATRAHLDLLDVRLRQRWPGGGGGMAAPPRAYTALEADRMLPLFMADGLPDRQRFHEAIGKVIAAAAQRHPGHVYIFGEMVAILCGAVECQLRSPGGHQAAVQVERYFNELLEHHSFTLLCAYPLSAFPREQDRAMFQEVCALHGEVLPAESYDPQGSADQLRRTVASLQQQAYALACEVHDRRQVERALREVNFDPLTGLPNRSVFLDRLEMEIRKAHRTRTTVALLFIDLDHFKEINDTLGHVIGDRLLKQVGERLVAQVRECDSVSRLGGDEFTVTLSDLGNLNTVTDVAQEILAELSRPFELDGEVAYISGSVGITLYPQDAATTGELVRNADQAMYQSKKLGRNRVCYFTPGLQVAAQTRMTLGNDLRRALDTDQLRVHYQPVVDMADRRIVKAEALLRWQHPERGAISPNEFIPIAEHNGMIVALGDWVFHMALAQAVLWRAQRPRFNISVNVSPAQLYRGNDEQCSLWIERYAAAGRAGHPVMLEITEGMMLTADEGVMVRLNALHQAGIQIALDDFGTGYSSLSYLRKFDLDFIKIDQSFVCDLEHDAAHMALCDAIIVMAHKLDLKVIAEGIETPAQYELLRRAGCDYGQGFLFGRAMPAERFGKLLAGA
ncbi:putative bifunctional diguanylate cyclase/phosphodiesterase [Pseudoduganella namucuonensis]|uniref:putative bifunctional diguanylate cyclase/phosphodiesterase n=1 Tax=Pseudoduganella namucuonensis TaxID=1035707 RepID=UPI0015A6E84B|nr:EAL domain-containing protein [Pseudoduganella namucuonensis]